MINYWPLLGIALVVLGFALRFNPLLVVAVAAIITGLLGGMDFLKVLATLGKGFNDNRYVTISYIVLPVIGILERYGLQQRARTLIPDTDRMPLSCAKFLRSSCLSAAAARGESSRKSPATSGILCRAPQLIRL